MPGPAAPPAVAPGTAGAPGMAGRLRTVLRGKEGGGWPGAGWVRPTAGFALAGFALAGAGSGTGRCGCGWAGSSGQGGPGRRPGHPGESAGRPPAGGRSLAGGSSDGRATAASIRPASAGQPSSRRCLPLVATGPVGRGAALGRAGDRAPARPGQIDRRTRSKSRSRISRTPAIACQGVQGPGYD